MKDPGNEVGALVAILRGSGWGLVLNVIWPFLMFSAKACKILIPSVLKKLTVKC